MEIQEILVYGLFLLAVLYLGLRIYKNLREKSCGDCCSAGMKKKELRQ